MALRNQSMCPQDGCNSLRIVGDGDSLKDLAKAQSRRGQGENAVEMHQLPRGPSAPGKLVGCSLLMASSDVEWWLWRRLASVGVEWCAGHFTVRTHAHIFLVACHISHISSNAHALAQDV